MVIFLIVSTLLSAAATFVIVFGGLSSSRQRTSTESQASQNQQNITPNPEIPASTKITTPTITPTSPPVSSPTPLPVGVVISPYITATTSADKKRVSLLFNNVLDSRSALYKFTYLTDNGDKSASGNIAFSSGQEKVTREIILGVCSGSICTYDTGVKNIKIVVTFTQKDGSKSEITYPYQL